MVLLIQGSGFVSVETKFADLFHQLWLKVNPATHPDHPSRAVLDIEDEIFRNAIDNGVLCARGSWFQTEPDLPVQDMFFRATFASASEEAMSTAIQRLGAAIRKSYRL